jgi:hypothetical protein
MKKREYVECELVTKYNSQRELNKRNFRSEKETYGAVSGSECLRWAAERRYL